MTKATLTHKEKISLRWYEILSNKPNYLTDVDYSLIKEHYNKINTILIKCIENEIFTDKKIDLIYGKIDTYHLLMRRTIGDTLFLSIWVDNLNTIAEMIEDCSMFELYEGAANLKKILDKLNA
jgi:hypothetical protein